MELYSKDNLKHLIWPETDEALQAKAFLVPMMEEGVEKYIENVNTQLYLLKFDDNIIPITVNATEYQNSYLTSNYFPINYLEEKLPQKFPRLFNLQKPFVSSLGMFLKGVKINKMVMINNWLLTTNIYPSLNEKQIEEITVFLSKKYPDHILVFRSLNILKCKNLTEHLKKRDYRLVGSRFVFFYDPNNREAFSSKVHYHHRRDRRLFQTHGYEIIRSEDIEKKDISGLLDLYRAVYVTKHTRYSPQYTETFLQKAIGSGYFEMLGVKKAGKIEGIMGCHFRNGTMIIPFFGYEIEKEHSTLLYRMLTMLAIDEAEKRNVILNDGNGGSQAKKFRGMNTFPEYVAVYDRHLPIHRRIFWGLAAKVATKFTLSSDKDESHS